MKKTHTCCSPEKLRRLKPEEIDCVLSLVAGAGVAMFPDIGSTPASISASDTTASNSDSVAIRFSSFGDESLYLD
mgnify:CR=1 FL=1|jgi:hypothetical protein